MAKVQIKAADANLFKAIKQQVNEGRPATPAQEDELRDLRGRIQDQIDAGREPTANSTKVMAAIDTILSGGSAPSPSQAVITQDHYDVSLRIVTSGPIDDAVVEVKDRLEAYVDLEDATAEFRIEFQGGASRNTVSRSDYVVTVNCKDDVGAERLITLLAPHLVEIYDEMDSDYDSDVTELLLDM